MEKVYFLYHYYERGDDTEIKHLGIYSSYENAEKAKKRYFQLEGFSGYPENCFYIDEYNVDADSQWTEGFVNTGEAYEELYCLTLIMNQWFNMEKNIEDSWKDELYYNFLLEISYRVNTSETINELARHIQCLTKDCIKTEKNYCECQKISQKIFNRIKNN